MEHRAYVCTERAHYMCPNMHFGILARLPVAYDAQKARQTVLALQAAHPFLRSRITDEPGSGRLFYQAQDSLDIPLEEKADVDSWARDYDALAAGGWNVKAEALLKLQVYPAGDGFWLLVAVHHLLCDGRGLLQLACEFAEHYVKGSAPAFAPERLIASLADLPPKSDLPLVSRALIDDANRRWDRERRRVSYDDYLAFERRFLRENPVQRSVTTLGTSELEQIHAQCRQHGVSVNDWLIAKMLLEEGADKLVIAEDIRSRLACYHPGALGNYSTAFSVALRKRDSELFAFARQASAQVAAVRKEAQREMLVLACYLRMRPELLDAAAISALGGFDSAAGRFVGGRMFGFTARSGHCVTNLGRIESDVIDEAVFIPPASPANKTTWGVLTLNGQMKLCSVRA